MTEFNISQVYLMLGPKCNYHCRHCIQCGSDIKEPEDNGKAIEYIRHLAAIRPPQIGKLTVMFWGGEPLLYYDKIIKIVEHLGDAVYYSMVSNGSLLTDDIVDFCNKNNMRYILSNDGMNTNVVRGENLLEDDVFLKMFLRLKNRAIDAVVSAHNQDYYKLWEYIDEKAPGTKVYTEMLECTWDMPEDMYAFDFEAYENMMKDIVDKAHNDILSGEITREVQLLQPYAERIMRVIKKMEKGENAFLPYPSCKQVRNAMNVDLAGNIYACHNFPESIGTVEDDYDVLLQRYDAQLKLNESCVSCPFFLLCRGGCPYAKASFGKEQCCKMKRIFIDACLHYVESFADTLEDVEL